MSRATIYRRRRFPASLEVDRYLYEKSEYTIVYYLDKFPAPREVDRYLYRNLFYFYENYYRFPSPLKVDRYLYKNKRVSLNLRPISFRPLAR